MTSLINFTFSEKVMVQVPQQHQSNELHDEEIKDFDHGLEAGQDRD